MSEDPDGVAVAPAGSLLDAVEKGNLKELESTLALRISELNETGGSEGYTPLIAAVVKRNVKMVELLLNAGANPNVPVNGIGVNAGYTGVHIAAKSGDVDIIKALHKAGGDINLEGNDSWCPMHVAAFAGKRNTLLCLLDCGAEVDIPNRHALTPLMYVCDHGRIREIRDLLNRGASIEKRDVNGDGMLHHALHYQMHKLFDGEYDMPECQYDAVVTLAMYGADPDVKNNDGAVSTTYALDGMREVLRILHHHKNDFLKSKTEWNYLTLLSAQIEHFVGMGLPLRHASDLYEALKKLDRNRIQHQQAREEARKNQGGCPVIRSKQSSTSTTKLMDGVNGFKAEPSSDPSNGQCPFFNKKTTAAVEEINTEDHSPRGHDDENHAPPEKKCPFQFSRSSVSSPAISSSTGAPLTPSSSFTVRFILEFIYEYRSVIMMCIICFLLGSLTERKLTTAASTS